MEFNVTQTLFELASELRQGLPSIDLGGTGRRDADEAPSPLVQGLWKYVTRLLYLNYFILSHIQKFHKLLFGADASHRYQRCFCSSKLPRYPYLSAYFSASAEPVVAFGRNRKHRGSILTNHLQLSNYLSFRKRSEALAASLLANANEKGSWAACECTGKDLSLLLPLTQAFP